MRYTPDTRSFLAKHTDDSDISFNILLSEEFEGGGTQFWNRMTNSAFVKVQPTRAGQVLAHSALLQHEGLPVTQGVRHILVGFLAVDHEAPLSPHAPTTGMSWFASWLSLPFLNVKFKEGYEAAHHRRQNKMAGLSSEERWTDHKIVRSLFRDLILFVEYLGDVLCSHLHYDLVEPEHRDAYLQRMKTNSQSSSQQSDTKNNNNKAMWFQGQQIRRDFDGGVSSQWSTRREKVDLFKEL